jgi:hypothetical protein
MKLVEPTKIFPEAVHWGARRILKIERLRGNRTSRTAASGIAGPRKKKMRQGAALQFSAVEHQKSTSGDTKPGNAS